MRKILLAITMLLVSAASQVCEGRSDGAPECWELSVTLRVPRVYDNTDSRGYRRYQSQRLHGYFYVTPRACDEPEVSFCYLENKTHKINKQRVTYDVLVDDVKWHAIGDNLTNVFKERSVVLSVLAEPFYALGPAGEDNSLVITLAGCSAKYRPSLLKGYVAGQLGCSCSAYGHTSPTRIWMTGIVVDTAAVFGTWTAKRVF